MIKISLLCLVASLAPMPILAQVAPPPLTLSGSAALVSDYRFRGVSQSDRKPAVQAGLTLSHSSGFYGGTWGSSLAGWGTFGGANLELDLIGGIKRPLGRFTIDAGLAWYLYPGGASNSDFAEPFAKLSTMLGPASLLVGVAYAPRQEALGNFSNRPDSRGQKQDNLHLWGDAGFAVLGTPLTLKGHAGYSSGNPGLGPNGTSLAPTGRYVDWLIGADYGLGRVTLGLAYVDTDIGRREAAYLQPNFGTIASGAPIAGGRILFSIGAAF